MGVRAPNDDPRVIAFPTPSERIAITPNGRTAYVVEGSATGWFGCHQLGGARKPRNTRRDDRSRIRAGTRRWVVLAEWEMLDEKGILIGLPALRVAVEIGVTVPEVHCGRHCARAARRTGNATGWFMMPGLPGRAT
jgi:hypothetical protein